MSKDREIVYGDYCGHCLSKPCECPINSILHIVSNLFHCQRQEEMESKCETQCEHCKEYYKGTDNGC